MKTVIYYFSGTGNSLVAAKKIASGLRNCELVPIASLSVRDSSEKIVPTAERVGIVCPVYFTGLPLLVAEFAVRLDLSSTRYGFAVVTFGGSGDTSTIRQLDAIIRVNGHGLDCGFSVKMPGNYIFMYDSPSGEKLADILAGADTMIAEIISIIDRCEHRAVRKTIVGSIMHAIAYPWFVSHARTEDRKFTVTDSCTSCGTCARVCPVGNIELVSGKPVWQHRCEVCCGCIHLCPTHAIEAGKKSTGRIRYHHPDLKPEDIQIQREAERSSP